MTNNTFASALVGLAALAACMPMAHAQRNLASNGSGTVIAGDNNASVIVNGQQIITATDGNARVETTIGGGSGRVVVQGASTTVTNSSNAKPGKGGKSGDYVNSDLSGRNFAGAQLAGRKFTNVDLSRANLSGADLRGAELVNVNLEQADLRGANLSGAKMVNVDLDAAQLEGATWTDGRRCRAAC
ncbi:MULTISPECIES: pentapeptide repeat-containing protein [unclassified Acidovorax]|uniref:pentapeptide repeat-containing protein n=1 Tax=unclassified Acidovorax TaxID=2684926 RepID=UPI00070E682E|nr:pentapeptide repeat-containing protein [Acidovorax sp. Root219]KRC29056.1 hypothetical protein ASE28_19200 [Acidovorax sp. Root219]